MFFWNVKQNSDLEFVKGNIVFKEKSDDDDEEDASTEEGETANDDEGEL